MKNELLEIIGAGLKRSSIRRCSDWASMYRRILNPVTHKIENFGFALHPWAREMHDSDSEMMVGQKAAQMGFTEVALNKTFYHIDIKKQSVLYVLPTDSPDAGNFSSSRFDPALEMSPHLTNLFGDTRNIGHKRAGPCNLFIVGSRSRSRLKSNPCAVTICDEVEEMNFDNIALIPERMAGQVETLMFLLSTPSLPGQGINVYYQDTTQEHWFIRCPACNRYEELVFPDSIVITSDSPTDPKIRDTHLICRQCKAVLPHQTKPEWGATGKWIPQYPDRMARGFHIPQLYSMTLEPYKIAIKYLNSTRSAFDEQDFWNSKLGLPHEVQGARVLDSDLQVASEPPYAMFDEAPPHSLVTIGIDVGRVLHYEVDQWFIKDGKSLCRVLRVGECDYSDLKDLFHAFKPQSVVIDSEPEHRKSLELARQYYGLIQLCGYNRGTRAKEIVKYEPEEEFRIGAHRTSWLDHSLGRFQNGSIRVPTNTPIDYRNHMKSLVRSYKRDSSGNDVGVWLHRESNPDHYAHARNYAEIAFSLIATENGCHDIYDVV